MIGKADLNSEAKIDLTLVNAFSNRRPHLLGKVAKFVYVQVDFEVVGSPEKLVLWSCEKGLHIVVVDPSFHH